VEENEEKKKKKKEDQSESCILHVTKEHWLQHSSQ
jgi:hypothetical protein